MGRPRLSAGRRWGRLDASARTRFTSIGERSLLGGLGIVAQGTLRLVYTLLLGRASGPALLGSVNAQVSLAMFAGLLWPTSAGAAATKFVAIARGAGKGDDARAVAWHLAWRTIVVSAGLSVAGALVSWTVLGVDGATAASTALLILTYSCYSFVRGLRFGVGQFREVATWDLVMLVVAVGGLAAVLSRNSSAWALLPLSIAYGLFAIQGWPVRPSSSRIESIAKREMNGFIALGVVGTLASAGLLQLSMVVAGAADTPERAGLYAAALTLAFPAALFARSLGLAIFPSMAEAYGRGDVASIRRQADASTRALVLTMVPLAALMVVLSPELVLLFFGTEFAGAGPLLVMLSFAVLPQNYAIAAVNSLTSRTQRATRAIVAVSAASALIACVSWLALVPEYGVSGVAAGYLLGATVQGVGALVLARLTDGHRWGGLAGRLALGYLAMAWLAYWRYVDDVAAGLAVGALAGFIAIWLLLGRRDVARLRSAFSSRRAR